MQSPLPTVPPSRPCCAGPLRRAFQHLRAATARVLGGLALLAALAACGPPENPASDPDETPAAAPASDAVKRPNVVLIVFDTTRADRCSVHGYERDTTPTLEALAAEGARFANCWSPSPWTPPAHASLFTGLRPANHGLMGGAARFYLPKQSVTLAEHLEAAGYATACFTSNEFVAAPFGLTQGFDHYWAAFREGDVGYPASRTAHELGGTWALGQHERGRPFFLFINDLEPHTPYEPIEPYRSRYVPDDATEEEIDEVELFKFPRALAYHVGLREETPRYLELVSALYDAEIAMLDATLRPLVDRLAEAGILDDTVFIVTSDHGENLGERHMSEHVFSCNSTLLHVPLVIRYPEAFDAGTRVDDLVRLEDLFPTILELCGVTPPPDLDGTSLLRDLPGRIARADYGGQEAPLDAAIRALPRVDLTPYRASMRSVFDGRHHLIRRSDGIDQLYDLSNDPLELVDLAASAPELVRRLSELLE